MIISAILKLATMVETESLRPSRYLLVNHMTLFFLSVSSALTDSPQILMIVSLYMRRCVSLFEQAFVSRTISVTHNSFAFVFTIARTTVVSVCSRRNLGLSALATGTLLLSEERECCHAMSGGRLSLGVTSFGEPDMPRRCSRIICRALIALPACWRGVLSVVVKDIYLNRRILCESKGKMGKTAVKQDMPLCPLNTHPHTRTPAHMHTCTRYCKKKQKAHSKTSSLSPPPFPASAYRSYDQMSVCTQDSVQPESQWDAQSESTSMISFDMSRPHSPTSPSKYFKVCFGCNSHICFTV